MTFRHRAGVTPYTSSCELARSCVFDKQSPRLIPAPSPKRRRDPFSRSYGVRLPSSLTAVLSSALGYSPCLPVSVLVRTTVSYPTRFSRTFRHRLRQQSGLEITPYGAPNLHNYSEDLPWKTTRTGSTFTAGAGILTCCASTTPFGLVLASD